MSLEQTPPTFNQPVAACTASPGLPLWEGIKKMWNLLSFRMMQDHGMQEDQVGLSSFKLCWLPVCCKNYPKKSKVTDKKEGLKVRFLVLPLTFFFFKELCGYLSIEVWSIRNYSLKPLRQGSCAWQSHTCTKKSQTSWRFLEQAKTQRGRIKPISRSSLLPDSEAEPAPSECQASSYPLDLTLLTGHAVNDVLKLVCFLQPLISQPWNVLSSRRASLPHTPGFRHVLQAFCVAQQEAVWKSMSKMPHH